MTTMREHLTAFHKMAAAHHLAMAKSFHQLGKCMSKSAKSDMKDDDETDPAEVCKSMSDAHVEAGEYHAACAKSLEDDGEHADKVEKGMHNEQDRIVPDRIHRINPTDGLRLAPRTGAPTAPQAPKVAPGLEKFVAVNEE
jgi:hypothetical protein